MLYLPMSPEVEKLVNAGKLSHEDGERLSKLTPGAFCVHKSWGAGRVAEWDLLGDRIVIDFEDKPGHPMKLSFAVGSLEPLPDEHLLARRVGDLAGLKAMAKSDPVGLVVAALKSHGSKMSLDALEKFMVPKVLTAAEYKSWWTAAKKALKDKRHIVVPAKRTEQLVLREEDASPVAVMLQELVDARDLKAKLAAVSRLMKDIDLVDDPATELTPVFEEISSTVSKSWRLNLKDSLHLLVARDELKDAAKVSELPAGCLSLVELMRENRAQLADAVNGLPAAFLGRVYRVFPLAFPERGWVVESLNHLTRTGGRAVAEIASVLDANDELDVLAEFLKKAVRNRQLSTDLLIWMCKERKGKAESVFDMDLGNAILSALEDDHIAGGPKRTGRLSDAFTEDAGLLPEMVADADADEVRLFGKRILATPVFDGLTRRSLMGRLIKTRPEMQVLMDDGSQSAEQTALIVSWESMEHRKLELEDLVKVQIPQNKKDIQIAREYGDLRENFEYKSARQHQAVLLRLQSKYERELRNARGTDFVGVSTDSVGIGTVVDLEDVATGHKETHSVLGAWDGNPDKFILSYLSEMAKAIIGKKVGEEAEVPHDTAGTRKVRVTGIRAYRTEPPLA
jgi:transcription elongation GreA/GreB family factor